MDFAADSASVGLNTSITSAIQCLSAAWKGSHFPGPSVDHEKDKESGLIETDVDNGYGLRIMGGSDRY